MKKKILEVVGRMDRAGQETFLMNVFRSANKSKYDFTFSVNGSHIGDYEPEIEKLGGKIFHNLHSTRSIFRYLSCFRKFLRENGPFDVVHCHTFLFGGFIMWGAYKEKVPIRVMHSHSTNDGYNNSLYRKIYRSIARNLIKKYSTVRVACGEAAYKSLYECEVLNNDNILNNSIDIDSYNENKIDYNKERENINCNNNEIVFISVARFLPVKNHSKIIDVFYEFNKNINNNSKLLLVGDGEKITEIKNLVYKKKLEKNVIFLGKRSDVNKLLLISDIFLMPSLYEGLPVSLVEAQAAGIPCVISDVITDEVDMNLDLIKKISLNADSKIWANTCHEVLENNKRISFEKRKIQLDKKGYTLEGVWKKLERIYDGKLQIQK